MGRDVVVGLYGVAADARFDCDATPIDRAAALAAAERALADLQRAGVVNAVPHALIAETGSDGGGEDRCGPDGWIRGFRFVALLGGVPVPGIDVHLSTDGAGRLHSASTTSFEAEVVGARAAATSDAEAIARMAEAVEAMYPNAEIVWQRNEVSYLMPSPGDRAPVEPVVFATFVAKTVGGPVQRPRSFTLSLTEANAPLVLLEP